MSKFKHIKEVGGQNVIEVGYYDAIEGKEFFEIAVGPSDSHFLNAIELQPYQIEELIHILTDYMKEITD
jgi:hypothetical protein